MSRIIQQIATVQFQVDNRKVTASMDALQVKAQELNQSIAVTNQNIKNLGNVAPDNENLVAYQKQLRQLNSDLKDVTAAQRDLMKGVKAADQLWKAAKTQDIESLSIKAIKAGQNGLRKRMENLRPELGGDEQKMYDAYKAVIDEADRVMNVFKSNYATVVQTIRDGGIVSEQAMKSTRDALRDLMESEKEGTAEHRQLAQQYDFLNESLANVAEMRRREKGEIVNANDARREALKLTEDGIAAARRERDMADAVIAGMQQQKSDLDQMRRFHEDRIAQTEREIAANQRLEEAEQDRLADVEKAMRYTENEDRKEAIRLRKKADAAAEQAELLDAIARRNEAVGESQAKIDRSRQRANEKLAEYISLNQKAGQMEEKVANQEERHAEAMDHQSERIRQIRADGQRLLDQYDLQKKELQNVDKAWADADVKQGEAEARKAQNQELTIKSLDDSIRKLKEANAVIDTNSDEWEENTNIIQRLQAALDEMKNKPALMMMTDRMQDVSKLSTAAVTETRKFWEAMVAGAERGSKELAEYEGHLKTITEEEQKRAIEQTHSQALRVKAGLFTTMDENELRESINAAREYQKTLMVGGTLYNEYSEAIAKAEKHLRDNSVETERAKLSQQEMNNVMRQQLDQGTALTESALRAQQQYWQRLIDDPKTAAKSLDLYKANLKEVQDLQQQQANELRDTRAARLDNPGNFNTLSEQEIREAIEAGKQLIQTYETGDARAKTLGENIVRAEEHLKQYGLEAARTAQREADAIEKADKAQQERISLMVKQWNETRSTMSESALKSHERFWQQLIDDPKTAAESLDRYRENLAKVQREIEDHKANVVQNEGVTAFGFFERGDDANASADEVKKQADALKKYRDSLPKQDEAETIAKINEHLQRVGQSAKKASEDVMSLDDALKLAEGAGGEGFLASPQQIQSATKALNERRDAVIKLIQTNKALGNSTDAEEAELADLTKKLRDLKYEQDNYNMSQEKMQMLMKTPTNAVNLEELRAAIKRADAELRRMEGSLDKNSDKYKELAEDVKNAKGILKEMEGQAKATTSAFDKAWSRLKTYVGLYVGASVAMNKLMGTIGDIHELSDRMGEVGKTTQMTADEVGRLTTNLKKIDTRTGIVQLLELSAAAGQLGLKSEEDIQGFTEAANKLMVALPEMGREAATEMMRVAIATGEVNKIQKEMQEGTIEGSSATAVAMEKIASTIDRLRASSASAAPEITDFVKRVGAVGAQSGITIDQVAALGSTVSSLGMRIEMSATALSRMIPAIKNNAFELSKAIGVTPETIRNLFDTGRGMEVILMILQRIKDSGMDADSIEQMLGMAGMKDIMKDLNQQGARAGIVFSGLSQNVDELRRQLGVAKEAYEENIAIQQEYDRMNETTAAKWERLKNQVEEVFVGDASQRMLGGLIDGLKWLLSLVTENSRAFMYAAIAIGSFKAGLGAMVADGITKLKGLKFSIDSVKKSLLTWPNLWNAIGTVAVFTIMKIVEAATSLGEISKSMGEVEKQLRKEMAAADKLFRSLTKVREEERRSAETAKEQAAAEEKKNKTTEKSTEKTKQLSKETEKLAKSEKDAAEQSDKVEDGMKRVNNEGSRSASIIREINSKYGTYLGYMISETSSARQLADARELINKKLRETITLKQKEAAMSNIEQEYGGKVRKAASSIDQQIAGYFSGNDEAYARVSVAVSEAAQKYAKDAKRFEQEVKKIFLANKKYINQSVISGRVTTAAQSGVSMSDEEAIQTMASGLANRAGDYRKSVEEYQKQTETAERVFEARTNVLRKESQEATVKTLNSVMADWREALDKYKKAEGEEKEKLAVEVYKQQRAYNNLFANNADYFTNDSRKGTIERSIENMKTYEKGLREVADESIRAVDAAERAETKITNTDFTNGGNGANNPWGTPLGGESTDWKNMTAEQLVNRRKQMKDFVNAIQTDTDVQSVLKEDAALKKAIENGMSSDMRTVIEWYNSERLKIQDELHARHLTNTGDWMDPKKQRNAHKQFKAELDAYLEELDAYYTERKAEIEKARSDEEITEGEAWRRNLKNENEWYNRRAELLKLYAEKSGEVTQSEQDAIVRIIAERTGDSVEFVRAMIKKTIGFAKQIEASGEKGAAMVHDWYAKIDLKTQQSMLKSQQAITKQVKFIEDTLAKERPYDGITKNLQDNLDKMGVLAAKMRRVNDEMTAQDKEPKYSNADITAQSYKEVAFFLNNAADAWSIDIDELLRRMAREGMETTAEEISKSDMLKQAVMGQLRKTYQEVQDAVKKEASQIKKNVEIIWNDEAQGIGGKSMKSVFDQATARLGMQQDSVSRANSLIGAGPASDNVATRLAMKQIEVQMRMQKAQYDMYRVQASQRITALKAEAAEHERIAKQMKQEGNIMEAERENLAATNALRDAENVKRSLGLTLAEETKKEEEQMAELLKLQEESQNRLYTSLREWADLLTSSLQGVMEASHTADRDYYNERAKLNLTGKGGPGAGTYIVIDNEGTSDARAHYEYLDERQALERQREIENDNAVKDAWKKMLDDLNQKMSDTITDRLNAMLQNQSIDANTQAVIANTQAIYESMGQGGSSDFSDASKLKRDKNGMAVDESGQPIAPIQPAEQTGEAPAWKPFWQMTEEEKAKAVEDMTTMYQANNEIAIAAETGETGRTLRRHGRPERRLYEQVHGEPAEDAEE